MGGTSISSYRPQIGLIRRQLMSRSNFFLVKHSKMYSLLSKLQELKLHHAENYDIPGRRIASSKTCLRIFLSNQHVLTLPGTENRKRHAFKILEVSLIGFFGNLFRQKCTVHGLFKEQSQITEGPATLKYSC